MKTISCALSLSLLVIVGARAADPAEDPLAAPAPAPAVSAAASPAGHSTASFTAAAKTHSSFNAPADARNPFWPIGWKKPTVKEPTGEPSAPAAPQLTAAAFVLTSVAVEKDTRFAIINGKVMREGQHIGVQMGAQTYEVVLKTIEDGQVILETKQQELIVPLRRK